MRSGAKASENLDGTHLDYPGSRAGPLIKRQKRTAIALGRLYDAVVVVAQAVARFTDVPRRLFLDSSTLQTIMGYGEFIWENVEPPLGDRAYRIPGFIDDLDALRLIFQVNQRAA